MNIEQVIKKYEDIALSNIEILKLVNGKANIVLYPNIYKYKTIDQILDPYGACFILFESKPKYGHWCLLFKINDHTLEFFNPYEGYPDDTLDFIEEKFKQKSNQDYPYLSELMIKSPYELTYNEYPFQKHDKNIKTCGRWCAIRLLCKYMSLNEFANLFYGSNGDNLVTLLTMFVNK